MRIWSRNTGRAALVAASALAVGAAFATAVPASADESFGGHGGRGVDMTSAGNFGLLNGTQVFAPISIPVNVCGNAIAVVGLARAQCKGGASVKSNHRQADSGYRTAGDWGGGGWGGEHGGRGVDMTSAGNFGLLNGTQVFAPISIPVDVCGNAVGVLGAAQAACKGGASVKRHGDPKVKMTSTGNFGAANGTQAYVPIKAPINACGNAVSLLGLAEAQCKGGATVEEGHGHKELPPTLRTPKKKKPYKPSKHRPAAKHKKLPSTMRSEGSRIANTAPKTAPNYRRADALPAVKGFVDGLRGAVPGVDVKPGQIGPKVPTGKDSPVTLGSPVLR
ncbi:chaplin family protein [Spirillospora sp. CA-108201]